jgi:hypothetical protein
MSFMNHIMARSRMERGEWVQSPRRALAVNGGWRKLSCVWSLTPRGNGGGGGTDDAREGDGDDSLVRSMSSMLVAWSGEEKVGGEEGSPEGGNAGDAVKWVGV